jgi:hypothetical protein
MGLRRYFFKRFESFIITDVWVLIRHFNAFFDKCHGLLNPRAVVELYPCGVAFSTHLLPFNLYLGGDAPSGEIRCANLRIMQ